MSGSLFQDVLVTLMEDPANAAGRATARVRWRGGLTLAAAIAEAVQYTGKDPAKWTDTVCLINAKDELNDLNASASGRLLEAGDEVVATPRTRDFGIGVAIAIALIGTIASFVLAPKVKLPTIAGSREAREQRAGFGRVTQEAFVGADIPVALGEIPAWGGMIVQKVPFDGEDGTSKLRLLYNFGHGPCDRFGSISANVNALASAGITDVELNDQPIAAYPGVRVWFRSGTADQPVIPGFEDTEVPREVGTGGTVLRNTSGTERTGAGASGEAVTFSTVLNVRAAVVRIRHTNGLYTLGANSQLDVRTVKYRQRWRTSDVGAGAGSWSAWRGSAVTQARNGEFYSATRLDGITPTDTPVKMDIQVERVSVEPSSTDPTAQDQIAWETCIEIDYSANNYPGLCMVAVELTAGDNLTSEPRLSAKVRGLKNLRIWDGVSSPSSPVYSSGWSQNPAVLAFELLTNATWGMGHADSEVDLASLFERHARSAEGVPLWDGTGTIPRYACNLVLATKKLGEDWLRTLCDTMRCRPVWAGGKWIFVADDAQAGVVERFGDGSIAVEDPEDASSPAMFRGRRKWTRGGVFTHNAVLGQFDDAANKGRAASVQYPDPGTQWLASEPMVLKTVRLEGITHREQAKRQVKFLAKRDYFIEREGEFTSCKRVVKCFPGEVVELASSLPGWATASGRVRDGCTSTSVKLDRDVTLAAATTYTITVVHRDGSAETRTVSSPAGTYAAGTAISVSSAFGAAPAEWVEYTLGRSGVAAKPVRVLSVAGPATDRSLWVIGWEEYIAGVYDDALEGPVTIPQYSDLPRSDVPPGPLEFLTAIERRIAGEEFVELAWRQGVRDAEMTATYAIYRRATGTTAWILVPDPKIADRGAVLDLTDPDRGYQFLVIAISSGGASLSPDDPRHPIATLVLGLAAPQPPAPDAAGTPWSRDGGTGSYTVSWISWEEAFVGPGLPEGTPTDGFQLVDGERVYLGDTSPPGGFPAAVYALAARMPLERLGVAARSRAGMRLAPGVDRWFNVRTVGPNGRLSDGQVQIAIAAPLAPPGQAVKQTRVMNFAGEGTFTNCAWNAGTSRIEMTNPLVDAVWLSPEIDPGSLSLTELFVAAEFADDTGDIAVNVLQLHAPSVEADQWAVIAEGPATVRLLNPPWPDDQRSWIFEARTHDGTLWSAWEQITTITSIRRTFRQYQVRVTMRRKKAPYRPAIAGLTAVLTH